MKRRRRCCSSRVGSLHLLVDFRCRCAASSLAVCCCCSFGDACFFDRSVENFNDENIAPSSCWFTAAWSSEVDDDDDDELFRQRVQRARTLILHYTGTHSLYAHTPSSVIRSRLKFNFGTLDLRCVHDMIYNIADADNAAAAAVPSTKRRWRREEKKRERERKEKKNARPQRATRDSLRR